MNPNDVTTHHWYALLLQNLGRFNEALAEIERGLALDPASPQMNANRSGILVSMRRYDEALALSNELIAANPEFPVNYEMRGNVYWLRGKQDAAVADWGMQMKTAGRPEWAEAFAAGYRQGKVKGACEGLLAVLKSETQTGYVSPNELARLYGLMGDPDHMFEWLEKGHAGRAGRMEYLKTEVYLEPYRSEPRYIDLLKRMGLPQ